MSSAAAKKKTGAKERNGAEGAASVTSVQSAFISAARATVWPIDSAAVTSTLNGAAAAAAAAAPSSSSSLHDSPRAFTAAANAICGRPFGATELDDAWSHGEVAQCVQDTGRLLPSTAAWAPERAAFARLFPASAMQPVAPPDNPVYGNDADGFTRATDALYVEWLAHVAAHHGSPLLYPHHTLHFDATSMLSPAATAASPFQQVAGVLHRLLTAYVERCSESGAAVEGLRQRSRVPSRVFASMLYTSVYNDNFSGPAAEQRDVAFGLAGVVREQHDTAAGSGGAYDSVANTKTRRPRRYDALQVVSCLGASHLCVCAGQRYYKLSVVDERQGRLRSVGAIAAALEAIHHHAEESRLHDPLPDAAPAVRRDHQAMDALFAHLSSLRDVDAFEVRRRLRAASPVNACSLDTLQEGICTLVLKSGGPESSSAGAGPVARWLHSVCSFEVSLHLPLQWAMRLQAAVVPCQAGVEWIARAAAAAAAACPTDCAATSPPSPPPTESGVSAEDEKASDAAGPPPTTAAAAHALSAAMLSTPVDEEGMADYLELWLPEKHRVPLRPYPAPLPDPESTQTSLTDVGDITQGNVEGLLLSLLRAVVKAKRAHLLPASPSTGRVSEGWWPRVVLAVQPSSGGAPSLLSLHSPAIEHYYDMLAARPMLFAKETRQRIEAAAREEVRAVLNIGWHSATTVQTHPPGTAAAATAASSWWTTVADHPVDLCVSVTVLPRPTAASSSTATATAVRRVVTSLGLSAALLVNCTAQQTAAEAHLRASTARVVDAVVQTSSPATAELAETFRDVLASCT